MDEFELKFRLPPGQEAQVEAALRRGSAAEKRLRARYYDTADDALRRAGLVLRLRQEGRRWVQTAKGSGDSAFERLEHEVELPREAAVPDPGLHAGHPLGERLARALHGHDALLPRFETDVHRLTRVVEAADAKVEIALDRGTIRAGDAKLPVLEIEFEWKEGNPATLFTLARSWVEQHGLWLDPLSKSGVGWRLARSEPAAPVTARPPGEARGGAAAYCAAMLETSLQQVLGNARELALGTGGDDHVHQLRVGLRRLRTLLRELEGSEVLPEPPADVVEALRALFHVLGQHRDRATLVPRTASRIVAAGGPALEWDAALPDVGAAVRASAFQSAVVHLATLHHALRQQEGGGAKKLRRLLAQRLQKLHRRAADEGRHFDRLEQEQRHAVRKRFKRVRYLSELARPLFVAKQVDDYVGALKDLQDALGTYQDAVVASSLFQERADADPRAWYAVGWLAAREAVLAEACEHACRRAVRKAEPFWRAALAEKG